MSTCTRNYSGTPSYDSNVAYGADVGYSEVGYKSPVTYSSDTWFAGVPGYAAAIPYIGCDELEEKTKSGYYRLWLHNFQKQRNEESKIKDAVREVVAKIVPEEPVTKNQSKTKVKRVIKKSRTVEPEILVPELPPFKKAPIHTQPSVHEQLSGPNIIPMLMLSVSVSETLYIKLIESRAANDEEFNRNFLLLVAA